MMISWWLMWWQWWHHDVIIIDKIMIKSNDDDINTIVNNHHHITTTIIMSSSWSHQIWWKIKYQQNHQPTHDSGEWEQQKTMDDDGNELRLFLFVFIFHIFFFSFFLMIFLTQENKMKFSNHSDVSVIFGNWWSNYSINRSDDEMFYK